MHVITRNTIRADCPKPLGYPTPTPQTSQRDSALPSLLLVYPNESVFFETPHLLFKRLVKKFFVYYYYVIGSQPAIYYDNDAYA